MHNESAATSKMQGANKIPHKSVIVSAVNANAVLHADRERYCIEHGLDAIGNQGWLGHQAGAKCATLHPLAWATAIEVDFVIAPLLAEPGALRQFGRLAAAELQRQGVLLGVVTQVPRHIAMQQRTGGHHLGIQPRPAAQQAMEKSAMSVGPVHHRCYNNTPRIRFRCHNLVHSRRYVATATQPECLIATQEG